MNIAAIESLLRAINNLIWSFPLMVALLGTGVYFTIKLNVLKISSFKLGMKYIFRGNRSQMGDISNFASLCTVLSATLGTGNIVGVAVALSVGGPGVIFWLWISALLCLSIKYAEGLLAIKYRIIGKDNRISGGPMYYIETGLQNKWLAKAYSLCGVLVAFFGIGTFAQSNSIVTALNDSFGISEIVATVALGIIVMAVTMGGIHRISFVAKKIVPVMTFAYIGAATLVLIMKFELIPQAFLMIVQGAFSPEAILGAGAGVTIMSTIHLGISRGIFSHESGLGSAAIAAAAAKTDSAVEQGLISMVGAFLTVVVCTMTGLVLIVTHNDTALFDIAAKALEGSALTSYAFGVGLKMAELGKYVVNLGIVFFAFTTIIGWNYYGEKCVQYLWGDVVVIPYKIAFVFFVIVGPFLQIDMAFVVADIVIGLMVIPNLIGIIGLRKIITTETVKFFSK
ncbi:MAG: amino acid carrier protein [Holosporaceae bacterium]|jgi:AGCS family alanine or glycine:cation symporter|nr:amino acid carrier protein [Holosporaceae bacterium]